VDLLVEKWIYWLRNGFTFCRNRFTGGQIDSLVEKWIYWLGNGFTGWETDLLYVETDLLVDR
jgi:hypothetical protein